MNAFVSQYVREQKRYTKNEIKSLFDFSESEVEAFIRRLKAYGVVKTVRSSPQQLDLSELTDGDVQITDETAESGDCFYVFTYVGVLTLGSRIIKCYPKYLTASTDPDPEMKQILKVLQRYSAKEQIINLYNGDGQSSSFNLLAVMLFLMEDYLHNGPYTNSEDIIELNGEGPILWEQTINNSFTIISNNRPYSFIILDAKYYCIRLEPDKPVRNQPGVGDVTKQYLYQLAYKEFIRDHSLGTVRNCFLMPTQDDGIITLGSASMDILDAVGLQQIQIRLLPASRVFDLYLTHRTMKVDELGLNA